MKRSISGILSMAMVFVLIVAGCEDEKEAIPPITVTLSSGNTSTDFKIFVFAAIEIGTGAEYDGAYILIVMGANATDTLIIFSLVGQLETDSPIALNNSIVVIIGTLNGGKIMAINGPGASGTLTFTRLDTLGFVSGQFSDDATLLAVDESEVTVNISGGFAAVGGSVDIIGAFSKKLPLLPGEGNRSTAPFD